MLTSMTPAPAPHRTIARLPALYPVAMVAAPLLLLASTIAFLTVGGGINDGILGGVLTVWSVVALALALLGCSRLVEASMPRGAQVLTFGAVSVAVGGAGFGIAAIYVQLLRDDFGIDGVAAFDAHPLGILALLPWGWFMPISCVLAGALFWRSGILPWWHGVLFILGGVLFVTSRPAQIAPIAIATDLVLVAAFAGLGLRLLAQRTRRGDPGAA